MIGTVSARTALRLGMGASALAMAAAAAAQQAQTPCTTIDEDGVCVIEVDGASGPLTISTPVRVINTGSISNAGSPANTPAISGGPPAMSPGEQVILTAIIENRAGATITAAGGTGLSNVAVLSNGTLINAGAINGPVTGLAQYVADGGVINGALTLGTGASNDFNSQIFVQRGATTGVTGAISAGQGIDFYVRSFNSSTPLLLTNSPLPTSFEVRGVEALGAETTITLANAMGVSSIAGLGLMGNGNIVNTATIGTFNTTGAGFPLGFPVFAPAISYLGSPETNSLASIQYQISAEGAPLQFGVYQFGVGSALASFANAGTVNGDLRMTTASFENSGAINLVSRATGTLIYTAEDRDFGFVNSGAIAYLDNGARAGMAATEGQYLGDEDAGYAVRLKTFRASEGRAVTIANSGAIGGGLSGYLVGQTIDFTNSGAIAGIEGDNVQAHGVNLNIGRLRTLDGAESDFGGAGVTIANTVSGTIDDGFRMFAISDSVSFTNDGTISGRGDDNRAVSIEHEGENEGDAASFTFANTGTLNGDVVLNTTAIATSVANSGGITMPAGAFDPFGAPSEAMEVEVETAASQTVSFVNSGTIIHEDRAATALSFEIGSGGDANLDIVNSGTIRSDGGGTLTDGEAFGYEPGTQLANISAGLVVSAGEVAGLATVTIENQLGGVISAAGVYATASPVGATPAPDASTAYSTALLVTAQSVSITNAGTINGGNGTSLPDNAVLTADLPLAGSYMAGAIHTGASIDSVTNTETGIITGSIDLGAGNDSFANYGTIVGDIFLGEGNDSFLHLFTASFTGTADGGAGEDSLAIDLTGSDGVVSNALYEQFINFELIALLSNGTGLTIADGGELDIGEGSTLDTPGATAIQGGSDGESVSNNGTINGNIDLGDGDNSFINRGNVAGNIVMGDGQDILVNAIDGTLAGNIDLGDGNDSFENVGTIEAAIALGAGADELVSTGLVTGPVDLGAGDDRLTLGSGARFAAPVSGGEGSDAIVLATGGTQASPFELDGSAFTGFESLTNQGGTAALSGAFTVDQIDVTGGRLIGRAGSVLTGNIAVADGATFGSAGTINGDVAVATGGTLSPGASPGTMTVNGDATLAAGTTTLFEFQPSPLPSDQLLISGTLSIASGATLSLTGDRPLTPGVAYDLIVATGGIDGTFTTTNQAATVLGFLRYTADRLQLLGTFQAGAGVTPQVNASIDYVNAVLIGGASAALLDAVPSLLAGDGTADPVDFALVGPEAYASASQLGIEHGLTLAKAARSGLGRTSRAEPGLFAFGQGVGGWRNMDGNAPLGVSGADIDSYGIIGGLGFGSAAGSIGAFVGAVDSEQKIEGIGARTQADGIVAGVVGRAAFGNFDATVLAAYDWSDADTSRTVPAGGSAAASYSLNSFVIDGSVGYSAPLAAGWVLRPELGFTHISTDRDGAIETGSAAFGLAVNSENYEYNFIDGTIGISGGTQSGAAFSPWAKAGIRHRLDDDRSSATAGFAGGTLTYSLPGIARAQTVAVLGAGASAELGSNVSLFGSYEGEFGDGSSHNLTLGVYIGF